MLPYPSTRSLGERAVLGGGVTIRQRFAMMYGNSAPLLNSGRLATDCTDYRSGGKATDRRLRSERLSAANGANKFALAARR
jgi:hypothetical protein